MPGRAQTTRRGGSRGVTLLELLVVAAVLGVVAALAVPTLLPTVARNRHFGSALQVAALVDQARRLAVASGRCHRVRKVGRDLVAERRGSGDCVHLHRDAAGTGAWIPVARVTPEIGVAFVVGGQSLTVPADVGATEIDDHRIVFRGNGRLWGDGDLDVADDGARVLIHSVHLPDETRAVVVEPIGRICSRLGAALALQSASDVRCP